MNCAFSQRLNETQIHPVPAVAQFFRNLDVPVASSATYYTVNGRVIQLQILLGHIEIDGPDNFSSLFKPISAAFLGNDKLQMKMNVAKLLLLLFVWSHI